MSQVHVTTTINGDNTEFLCEADEPLLDVLRDRLGMTGAKEGCGTGDCGACSVMVDGRLVCSCFLIGKQHFRTAEFCHHCITFSTWFKVQIEFHVLFHLP